MKQIIFGLLLFFSILQVVLPTSFAHLSLPDVERTLTAPTGLQFIIVDYSTSEDIDFLFEKSSRVLGFFEDMEGDPPFLLALVDASQLNEIKSNRYAMQVIDENTTLSDYMLLYNHSVDQSDILKDYVEVFPLSSHYTLIRIDPNEEFNPHEIPDAVEFGPVPFLEGISPPPPQEVAEEVATPTVDEDTQNSILPVYIAAIIFVILTAVAGGVLYFIRRKHKLPVNPPISSPDNNSPPQDKVV